MNDNDIKLKILNGSGQLIKAIDDEVDWFIAYLQEKDKQKKAFYFSIFKSKQDKRIVLARRLSHG
jgi:hypothetical protein